METREEVKGYRPSWIISDILPACDSLHCQKTGSADTSEDYELLIKGLVWVLRNWRPTCIEKSRPTEDAIKNLIIAVLEEPPWFTNSNCIHDKDMADYRDNGQLICYCCGTRALWKG